MEKKFIDVEVSTILSRLNRLSPDALISSLAGEFLRLNQAYQGLAARLDALEVTQKYHDRIVPSERAAAAAVMPRSLTVDAAFSLPLTSGFYPLEYDQQGAPYRWTGPEPTFFFELFINRLAPSKLSLRFSQIYADISEYEVPCYVDGDPIDTEVISIDGEFEVQGILPPRDELGATVVMFICPGLESPADNELSEDSRKLGLAFRRLRIEPAPLMEPAPVEITKESLNVEVEAKPSRGRKARNKSKSFAARV